MTETFPRFATTGDRERFHAMFGDNLDEHFTPEFAAYVRGETTKAGTLAIDGTTVHTRVTTYTVTCLPDDPRSGDEWDIRVEFTGAHVLGEPRPESQLWAVRLRGHWCLSRDGRWDLEPSPSNRDDHWFAEHRFGLDDALKQAAEQAPRVVVNGLTPVGLLKWRSGR